MAAARASRAGERLPGPVRADMERSFGLSFADVRVHSGPEAAASARSLRAAAFTTGSDVSFAEDRYRPSEPAGRALLAHELAHVAQGRRGSRGEELEPRFGPAEAEARRAAAQVAEGAPAGPVLETLGGTALAPDDEVGKHGVFERRRGPPNPTGMAECVPYATKAEADEALEFLRSRWLPAVNARSSELGKIWSLYLSGGGPKQEFRMPHPVAEAFAAYIQSYFGTELALGDFRHEVEAALVAKGIDTVRFDEKRRFTMQELGLVGRSFDWNFASIFTIPGNIAGGLGAGDKGPDRRTLTGGFVTVSQSSPGQFWGYMEIEVTIEETLDLCPGDAGADLERIFTVPMKRLEASGIAGDVPYDVIAPWGHGWLFYGAATRFREDARRKAAAPAAP